MTPAFESAYQFTHRAENGSDGAFILSTLPGEKAMTYAGIYRAMQPDWEGWRLIDAGDTVSAELKGMVKRFYLNRFWLRMNLEQLPSPLSALVFDFGVNSGSVTAVQRLQRILQVKEDGVIGAKTAAMARGLPADKLNMRYIAVRLDYLNDLKTWKTFSVGWSQRIAEILNFAAQ